MDLLGTHVPKVQVESRTGRPTAEYAAASYLYAEPMNETAMKQRSAPRPGIGRRLVQIFKESIYLPQSGQDYASHNGLKM